MKVIIYLMALCFLSSSCSNTKSLSRDTLIGNFYGKSRGFSKGSYDQYKLELKRDSTFYFQIDIQDASPRCEGKWKLSNEGLFLKCDDIEDISKMMSSGYMNDKEHKIEILSKDKLEYKGVILKREE